MGEPSVTKLPVPLVSSSPSKSVSSDTLLHSQLKQLSSSSPQPSPIYTHSEPTTSTINPSKSHTSNPSSPPLQHFNLTITTLSISEALLFNEPISPPALLPHPHLTITYHLTLTSLNHLTLNLLHFFNSKLSPSLIKTHLILKPLSLPHLNTQHHHALNITLKLPLKTLLPNHLNLPLKPSHPTRNYPSHL